MLLITTILTLASLLLFMLAGAMPVNDGAQLAVFRTPVFVGMLFVLATATVVCCGRRRPSWRAGAFYLSHLSAVVILAGAFLGFIAGVRTDVSVPIMAGHTIDRIPSENADTIPLGFGVGVRDFEVQFYPPRAYGLMRLGMDRSYKPEAMLELQPDDSVQLPSGDNVPAERLKHPNGEWRSGVQLENGRILRIAGAMPKHFEAKLEFVAGHEEKKTVALTVNHPVAYRGWRFYLSSYGTDRQRQAYVELTARRDPGRPLVIAGMWGMIAGIAMISFRRRCRDAQ